MTEKAGVAGRNFAFGCSAADYDEDGDQDLLVLTYKGPELYRNKGSGAFTEVTEKAGLADPRWSLNAAWLDYDRDGDLDLFVANYLEYDEGKFRSFYAAAGYPGPLSYNGVSCTLYRNNGDGTFTDVTKAAGVANPGGRAMSVVAADLDNDGWMDLYVANDSMENYYYENRRDGTFVDKALELGVALGQNGQGVSSMGPAVRDLDGDGNLDILIPDMDYGSLLSKQGGFYSDLIGRSGLAVICGQYTGLGRRPLRLRQRRPPRRLHRERQRPPRVPRGRGPRPQQRQGRLRGRGPRVGRLLPDEVGEPGRHLGRLRRRRQRGPRWWSTPPARRTCSATAAAPGTTG